MPAFITTDIGRKYFFGRRYMGSEENYVPISLPPGNTSKERYRASVFEVNAANLENPVPPVNSTIDTEKYSGVKYGIKGGNYLQFGIRSRLDGGTGTGKYSAYLVWSVFDSSGHLLTRQVASSGYPTDAWIDTINYLKTHAFALLFIYNTQASTEYGGTCSTMVMEVRNTGDYAAKLQDDFDSVIAGRGVSNASLDYGVEISDTIARVFSGG